MVWKVNDYEVIGDSLSLSLSLSLSRSFSILLTHTPGSLSKKFRLIQSFSTLRSLLSSIVVIDKFFPIQTKLIFF